MGINKGKGGKTRKKCKNIDINDRPRELIFKNNTQEYAKIIKPLGNNRFEVMDINDNKTLGILCGSMKKKYGLQVAILY